MSKLVAIAGSPSHPSRTSAVLDYAIRGLGAKGLQTDLIAVRHLPPEDLLFAKFDSPAIKEAQAKVEQADGVVIATPIYKAAYTGVLKAFLDLLPPGAFSGKVILPIATGGTIAHLLAIDYALKPLIATLGARYVLGGVYLLDTQIQVNGESVQLDPEIEERLNASLDELAVGIQQVTLHQVDHAKTEPVLAPLE